MTPEQTFDLLTQHIAPRDGRTIGKVDATVWYADIGDLRFEDACAGVAAHFRESDAWLMPKHVRDQVKKIRERRLHDFQYVPVPGDDNTGVYLKALREQRAAVADGLREPAPAIDGGDPGQAAHIRQLCAGVFPKPPREPK